MFFQYFYVSHSLPLIISVTYVYLEGKSNYFKGALLLITYFVLVSAFFFE